MWKVERTELANENLRVKLSWVTRLVAIAKNMELTNGALGSQGEYKTNVLLRRHFRDKDFLIYKEMALRRVVKIDKEEVDEGEWDYYSKASLDFVICNDDSDQTFEMIIEYDGVQHEKNKLLIKKDKLKDQIFRKTGLPILRIGFEDVELRGDYSVLEFILDSYFGAKEFEQLREQGNISYDEDYFINFKETDNIKKWIFEKGFGFSVFDNGISETKKNRAQRTYWEATEEVFVTKAFLSTDKIFGISKTVQLRNTDPNKNVVGIYGWHIAQELAQYVCFKFIKDNWDTLIKNSMN